MDVENKSPSPVLKKKSEVGGKAKLMAKPPMEEFINSLVRLVTCDRTYGTPMDLENKSPNPIRKSEVGGKTTGVNEARVQALLVD